MTVYRITEVARRCECTVSYLEWLEDSGEIPKRIHIKEFGWRWTANQLNKIKKYLKDDPIKMPTVEK